jgi:hypothetical protein
LPAGAKVTQDRETRLKIRLETGIRQRDSIQGKGAGGIQAWGIFLYQKGPFILCLFIYAFAKTQQFPHQQSGIPRLN